MLMDWVGDSLGRYRIDRMVGRGGMGLVFRAHDPELQRVVALKVLYPHLVTDASLVERFRLEARIAANLRHPNIVAIYDVGQEAGRHFLVMEYLDGKPLSTLVGENGALPVQDVLDITAQIAAALDHIHQRGLVHRDVKSGNIIVEQEGRAVLTDFGIVRALVGGALTASGTILGTTPYLAPEQISLGGIGPWTDLYALGVVVYEMLVGELPFEADSTAAVLFQVVQQMPPSVSLTRASLPEGVDTVLDRMLAKDPRERYASGEAFVAALEQVLADGVVEIGAAASSGRNRASPAAANPFGAPPPPNLIRSPMPTPATRLIRPGEWAEAPPRRSVPGWFWATLGVMLLALVALGALLGSGVFAGSGSQATETPMATATPTVEPTASPSAPATATSTASPTSAGAGVSTATATPPSPTATPPSPTPVPSTSTPVPPTRVPPTSTRVPPTSTRVPPTITPVPPTITPIPPTDTPPPTTKAPPTTSVPTSPIATEPPIPTSTEPPPATEPPPPIR